MKLDAFIQDVLKLHSTGRATEHSYRGGLIDLFKSIEEGLTIVNEEKRAHYGAPDLSILRGDFVIGHVEAKDVSVDLTRLNKSDKAQQKRYTEALSNLIYTNCFDWHLFREGEVAQSVSIADIDGTMHRDQFAKLTQLLHSFIEAPPQMIDSTDRLATKMAAKAVLLKQAIDHVLQDASASDLKGQYDEFKRQLIPNISTTDFADLYAETIAYGLFVARLHHKGRGQDFTRQNAASLLPHSYPFLRNLFSGISQADLDVRIAWVIDDLVQIFRFCDLQVLMEGFGTEAGRDDPFIHFYEDFLRAYNPKKKEVRGVFYTPAPVVQFIVQAVDDVLKRDFGLPMGLADNSKTDIQVWQDDPKTLQETRQVHRVQILDPAAGTGTFLAAIIKHIIPTIKADGGTSWHDYVQHHLIPRLHGFELLMASYAMCHLKLSHVLERMGYQPKSAKAERLSIYLTNSLEEGKAKQINIPFAQWLANEANEANNIKRNMPIMCIIGNPPYSGESQNKGGWIMELMDAYKQEPGGGNVKLKEKNPKWLNDDYVKFIRLSEHLITRTGEGVLGFITNHGYLDNPTFRGMRWSLLRSFDKIYVMDLHGSTMKREVAPDGKSDKNVFDITVGVAIIMAVKVKGASPQYAEIWHQDVWGDRAYKYDHLGKEKIDSDKWVKLDIQPPSYEFLPINRTLQEEYQQGFCLHEFMPKNSVGIVTSRDHLTIAYKKEAIWQRVQDFATETSIDVLRQKYNLGGDVNGWRLSFAQKDVRENLSKKNLIQINYRPFDMRWTYYTGKSAGFHERPRIDVMQHMIGTDKIGLCVSKQQKASSGFYHALVHDKVSESSLVSNRTAEIGTTFPLYLNKDEENGHCGDLAHGSKVPNFDDRLLCKLEKSAMDDTHEKPDALAIFDYIYGVLYCPEYRRRYADFLKRDFPIIPYPSSAWHFWALSAKGTELRALHLMKTAPPHPTPYPFIGEADNMVTDIKFASQKVLINAHQYFAHVPESAWNFYIGGYQPAQLWLKNRKDERLTYDDIQHFQHIIHILHETDRLMRTIPFPL